MKHLNKSTNVRMSTIARGLAARLLAPISPAGAASQVVRLFITVPRSQPTADEITAASGSRSETMRVGERTIHLRVWGEEEPTALLVHGWGGRGTQLGAFVEPLRRQGLRVVTWDAPAHGASPGRITTLPELTQITAAMLRRFQPQALVAHSLGATATTLAFSRGAPACPAIYLAPSDDTWPFLAMIVRALRLPPEIAWLARCQVERMIQQNWRYLIPSRVAPWMNTPLLIFHDDTDRQIPLEQAQRLASRWPEAQLEVTHDLGHQRILQDPEVIRRGVEFLMETREPATPPARAATA